MPDTIKYSLSCGNWGDGKSICLWRTTKTESVKIARFQSDATAKMFADEFGFPLHDDLKKRLYKK
ncbi:hypothetical protein C4588_06210 [Candidatus Parcubacteria bacterium]|nr:MAG: hypothetical protein C4588_06210 [Candidatus Parcubacteria bacterium]